MHLGVAGLIINALPAGWGRRKAKALRRRAGLRPTFFILNLYLKIKNNGIITV